MVEQGIGNWHSPSEWISRFSDWTKSFCRSFTSYLLTSPFLFLYSLRFRLKLLLIPVHGHLVICVLVRKDKGSTELERWKAIPCTYTEVCNAAATHSPHHAILCMKEKGNMLLPEDFLSKVWYGITFMIPWNFQWNCVTAVENPQKRFQFIVQFIFAIFATHAEMEKHPSSVCCHFCSMRTHSN